MGLIKTEHCRTIRTREKSETFAARSATADLLGMCVARYPFDEPPFMRAAATHSLIGECVRLQSYFANSELWLATSFHEPSCRTKVSVDRIVLARCSP